MSNSTIILLIGLTFGLIGIMINLVGLHSEYKKEKKLTRELDEILEKLESHKRS